MREAELGGLKVRLAGGVDGEGGGDGPVAVLLHGYCAPPDELAAAARELAPPGLRLLFPEGPLAVEVGAFRGRAWFRMPLSAMVRELAEERPDYETWQKTPEGLPEARRRLLDFLAAVEAPAVALGGFSQGAMLAADAAFHSGLPLAGLVFLSGAPVSLTEWLPRLPARAGLRALVAHGESDRVFPSSGAERLAAAMEAAGLAVRRARFAGGHELAPAALAAVREFLRELF
jgi:phospholipase/carboxylesterase